VRNGKIRETVKVGALEKKIQESRLRCFEHVQRRDERVKETDLDRRLRKTREKGWT
jgi:hypothetical protein